VGEEVGSGLPNGEHGIVVMQVIAGINKVRYHQIGGSGIKGV
jgi:hypothetical protein